MDPILKHFFDITEERIATDTSAAAELEAEELFANPIPFVATTEEPTKVAEFYHQRMVHAFGMQNHVDEALGIYYASHAARSISEWAVQVAHNKGLIADLANGMAEIRKREGLHVDDDYLAGEGPEDHQALAQESNRLYMLVDDATFTTILSRYHLNAMLEMFESDRERYDKLHQEGFESVR